MNLRLAKILILMLIAQYGNAGEIAGIIKELGLSHINADTAVMVRKVSRDLPVVLRFEGADPVHVGLKCFSPEIKQAGNTEIFDFIERLMLRLAVEPTTAEAKIFLKQHHITLRHNGVEYGQRGFTRSGAVASRIAEPSDITVNYKGDKCTVIITFGKSAETLTVILPTARETVFGTDKQEADSRLHLRLTAPSVTHQYRPRTKKSLQPTADGLLYDKGNTFLIDRINNDIYYKPDSTILFSTSHPKESLTNLLLGAVNTNHKLNLQHKVYGIPSDEINISINSLLDIFGNDFEIYAASDPPTDKGVYKSILLFRHPKYQYVHLLTLDIIPDQIFDMSATINAQLFTNIPQHSIRKLF